MKTNPARRSQRVYRAALCAAWGALCAGACGGTVGKSPSIGSESHFLAYCEGSCADGLDCIGGICTRPCLTEQASCSDLAPSAACTNQSVEPGAVAVCDVSCGDAASCAALGAEYACERGYCRKSGGSGGPSNGSGGNGSATPGGGNVPGVDCNPVGRYQVGKEGGYLPCCPGLTELQTLVEGYVNNEPTPSCVSAPVNSFSCVQGFCGDGVCEDVEAPCGCGVDCPGSNWRAHPVECEIFRDQAPPPDVREISITNTGSVPLYIQPPFPDCLPQYPLLDVERDGEPVNVFGVLFCAFSCQQVMDAGWAYSDPRAPLPGPCDRECAGPSPVLIEPGQTLRQPVSLEFVAQQLPRGCAEGIATDSIECFSGVIPQPGNYTLIVNAAVELQCSSNSDCECRPDASGVCTNPNVSARASTPLVFRFPTSSYFQSQALQIAAPAAG